MVTKIGVIVHRPLCAQLFTEADRARLETLGAVTWTQADASITERDAVELLRDCDVAIGSWWTPYPTQGLLGCCPRLRLWEHVGGSVKHFFGPHMEGRQLTVASCAPAIAEAVAEMVTCQILFGLKRILPNAAANRTGYASKPANSMNLCDATVGVIAASQVGRRTISRLRSYGCHILLFDPYVTPAAAANMGVDLISDLVELCRASHAVTLHAPLLPATTRMLRAEHFQAMRDDAVLVNASRGGCIDESALIAELKKGRLFAFLDVSDPEPATSDSPLRTLPNVVYTSHIAGGADRRMGRQAVDDVSAFLAGGHPAMVVTADMLDRIA